MLVPVRGGTSVGHRLVPVFKCFWKVGPCQSWSFEFQTGFKVVSNCVQNEVLMEV